CDVPIADYTYYLRVTKIELAEPGFLLTFEAHRYFPKDVRGLDGNLPGHWKLEGSFTARMMLANTPPGYPQPDRFLVGEVAGGFIDPAAPTQLQMGWVSPLLRKAVIEIDRVPDSQVPQNNGGAATWQSVFQSFGWDVKDDAADGEKPDRTKVEAELAPAHLERRGVD